AAELKSTVARNRGNYPCDGIYSADASIADIVDKQVPRPVNSHVKGLIQFGSSGRTTIAAEPACIKTTPSAACNSSDNARLCVDAPDAMVDLVCDKQVALRVYCQTLWNAEAGANCRAAVAEGTEGYSIARKRADKTCFRVDAPDASVV